MKKTEGEAYLDGGASLLPKQELSSLVAGLSRTVQNFPDAGIRYIRSDGISSESYRDFFARSQRIGAGLREQGVKLGDFVLLQCEEPKELLGVLMGSMLVGAVPVPLAIPPIYDEGQNAAKRLRYAWKTLGAPIVLGAGRLVEELKSSNLLNQGRVLDLEGVMATHEPLSREFAPGFDDLAFVLLTSGSTGKPKIVKITHGNALSSVLGSIKSNGYTTGQVSLNWLPLNHVGALMRALREIVLGADMIQASYIDVVQEPLRWLAMMDEYRVNLSWAPNFAYSLVLKASEEMHEENWDLSCVTSLHTSGETISPKMMLAFSKFVEKYGLPRESLHTAWGMSEACFATCSQSYMVDLGMKGEEKPNVGKPIAGVEMRIVNEEDEMMNQREVGRLQIRGDAVTVGYYGDDKINNQTFTPDGWLRTGDLGIIDQGRLTLTGRESNVIIINGLNYAAEEIEAVVAGTSGMIAGDVAACVVSGDESEMLELAIFFHTPNGAGTGTEEMIIAALGREMGLTPQNLIWMKKNEIPRSEVGKIKRARLREWFEAGKFVGRIYSPTQRKWLAAAERQAGTIESKVALIFGEVLGIQNVSGGEDFFRLGGDSLKIIQIMTKLSYTFPQANITTTDIFRYPTIEKILFRIQNQEGVMSDAKTGSERAARRLARRKKRRA